MSDFELDWNTDRKLGRFALLKNWDISSIRVYRSKKGVKVHVVFVKVNKK